MEHVFDSVCRCFGGVPATAASGRREGGRSSAAAHPSSPRRGGAKGVVGGSTDSPEIKRRTSRLELQDKEWDGLFEHSSPTPAAQADPIQYTHQSAPVNPDLEYARAVAQAKLAGANPPRKQPSMLQPKKKKRKSPATKRDEIFRTRRFEQSSSSSAPRGTSSGAAAASNNMHHSSSTSLSRLLSNHPNVAQALCFATPVRDEDEEDDLPLNVEPDDDSTLNTCEDTMTSTVYFDSKYAHLVEKRPPMPLFSHFKVSDEQDHIRKIVATDSHNSLNMIRLFNENSTKSLEEQLQDSSSDDEPVPPPPTAIIDRTNVLQHAIPRRRPPPPPTRGADADPPPEPVKINSSSGSSKETASTCPSSSSAPIPEDGSVERL